jgi:uncharacterized protein (TIGR00251 family)
MIFTAKIIPNCKAFGICFDSEKNEFKIHLKSRPENGKANQELIKELRKLCKSEVRILKGNTSRKKTIEMNCDPTWFNSLKSNSNSLK